MSDHGCKLHLSAFATIVALFISPISVLADGMDTDGDGIEDTSDNMPFVHNPDQEIVDATDQVMVDSVQDANSSLTASSSTSPVLLYDVSFGTPPHSVGQPPTVGQGPAPRKTPTWINFGQPMVVSSLGALTDQPIVFDRIAPFGSTYEQLEFGLGPGDRGFSTQYPAYHVEMEVLVQDTVEFAIFCDMPSAHSVQFRPNRRIAANTLGPGSYYEEIGAFEYGIPVFLEIDIDCVNLQWFVSLNGTRVFSGDYPRTCCGGMRMIRLNFSNRTSIGPVAVDNIRILGLPSLAPSVVPLPLDIRPGSCPNPFNRKSRGIVPMAVLGTDEYDIDSIDLDSIVLTREGSTGQVTPVQIAIEDVGTPFDEDLCDCHDLNGDGLVDLVVKFRTQDIVARLGLGSFVGGEMVTLTVTGDIQSEGGDAVFEASDCIRLVPPQNAK